MFRRFYSKRSHAGRPTQLTPEITTDDVFADAVCEIYVPYDPYDQCLEILGTAPPRSFGLPR